MTRTTNAVAALLSTALLLTGMSAPAVAQSASDEAANAMIAPLMASPYTATVSDCSLTVRNAGTITATIDLSKVVHVSRDPSASSPSVLVERGDAGTESLQAAETEQADQLTEFVRTLSQHCQKARAERDPAAATRSASTPPEGTKRWNCGNGCEATVTTAHGTVEETGFTLGPAPTIHSLARRNSAAGVLQFIEGGEEVDARDSEGYTALHHAVQAGSSAVVELLLEKGADANARGPKGGTPLSMARAIESTPTRTALIRLLEAGGARDR